MKKKYKTTHIFIVIFLAIFLAVVYFWSVVEKHNMPKIYISDENRAIRGSIKTADGFQVVTSKKLYKASIDTRSIDPHKLNLFINLYSIYTNDKIRRVRDLIRRTKGYLVLSYKIDAKEAVLLRELNRQFIAKKVFIPFKNANGTYNQAVGMTVLESGERRDYLANNSLTPIIGYIKKDEIGNITKISGVKGIEKSYENYLNPLKDGKIVGPRDITNRIILERGTLKSNKIDGYDINLNINYKLQKTLENMLDKERYKYQADEIVLGIMESKSGKILALVSDKRYDPANIRTQDYSSLNPTATEYAYEVGSVMKPFVLATKLESDPIDIKTTYYNTYNGSYKLGNNIIRDTRPAASLSVEDIIVFSSNIGMIQLSNDIDPVDMSEGLKKFSFSKKTNVDLPYEAAGKLPSLKELKNHINKASLSYGYGLQATFMQLLTAFNVFNNDGYMITPRLTNSLEKDGKIYYLKDQESKRIISKENAHIIKDILIQVVQRGGGKRAMIKGLEIGGKTGTAHIFENGKYVSKYNASFFGFANDEENKYTIGVLVKEPKKNYFGSQSSAPIFKNAVEIMIELGFLKPYELEHKYLDNSSSIYED